MISEAELINRCINNDPIAQKMLFNNVAPKMLGVCMRYMNKQEDAEDVLQEGLIKVFQKLNSYSGSGSFEGWIRRIIVNTALDTIRKNKKMNLNTPLDDVAFSLNKDDYTIDEKHSALVLR